MKLLNFAKNGSSNRPKTPSQKLRSTIAYSRGCRPLEYDYKGDILLEHKCKVPRRTLDPTGFQMPITGVNNLQFGEEQEHCENNSYELKDDRLWAMMSDALLETRGKPAKEGQKKKPDRNLMKNMMNQYYEMKTNEDYVDQGWTYGISVRDHGKDKAFRK
jgi:hypothetical protein